VTLRKRASHEEIFFHLDHLLGIEAIKVVNKSFNYFSAGKKHEGFNELLKFDKDLGGIGIHSITNKKPEGIFRAFFYVWLPLNRENPVEDTRGMIHAACVYLEELLKKIVRTWPWENVRCDSLPLGTLVFRVRNRIPTNLFSELMWLSKDIYNFAKHHFNFDEDEEESPEHYFELDEAIAIYLIVRRLGLDLENYFGKH
jgi:hypothetical protein